MYLLSNRWEKRQKNEKTKNYGVFRVLDYALWKGVRHDEIYVFEKCVFSYFVIAAVSGCGKVETKDAKKKPTETSEIHNEYFPYTENCQIKVSGRFYFFRFIGKKKQRCLSIEKKRQKGEKYGTFFFSEWSMILMIAMDDTTCRRNA